MKRFKYIFRVTILLIFILLTANVNANETNDNLAQMDSVEISLLTCEPHNTIYSLYGHTAIRLTNNVTKEDLAINYGLFSFGKPFFILRFVFGLTDYSMGIVQFNDFVAEYTYYGCGVTQQVLNLTREEKAAIIKAIFINYEPQNRIYRYNYFYDNCTTRARDIITDNIKGKVVYKNSGNGTDENISYREMIHKYNEQHRWARLGNDLLLGVKADAKTTLKEQQFLPDNLCNDFATATVEGQNKNLVSKTFKVVQTIDRGEKEDNLPSPITCFIVFGAIIIVISLLEMWKNTTYWGFDLLLLLLDGITGLILFAMIFSQHPTVSFNLQILLLNPLSLIFLYSTIKKLRKRQLHWYIYVWTACILLFFVGGLFQHYAEGMYMLALSLLIRYALKIIQAKRQRQ